MDLILRMFAMQIIAIISSECCCILWRVLDRRGVLSKVIGRAGFRLWLNLWVEIFFFSSLDCMIVFSLVLVCYVVIVYKDIFIIIWIM